MKKKIKHTHTDGWGMGCNVQKAAKGRKMRIKRRQIGNVTINYCMASVVKHYGKVESRVK